MTNLLLIGLDGLRIDLVPAAMPRLAALFASGRLSAMRIDPPTWSGPSWATLLTGATVAEHGVTDNSLLGHRLAEHPDVLSLAFAADPSRTTFAAAGWAPLVDPRGPGPVIHARDEQRRASRHRVIVRDGDTYGFRAVDAEITDFAAAGIGAHGPDVSFVYLGEVDEASHLYGALSEECVAAMGRTDAHVARLVQAVQHRESLGERWLVVVTSDHGHLDEGGHGGTEEVVRRSFVARTGFGVDPEPWSPLTPAELTPRLLAALD